MPYDPSMLTKDMSFGAIVPDYAELGQGSRFCIWGSSGCANLRADSHFEEGTQKCSYCRHSGFALEKNGSGRKKNRITEGDDLIFCIGKAHGPDPANHELPSSHFRPREPYPGEDHRGVQAWKIKREIFCDHCRGIRERDTGKLTGEPISQQTYLPTDYFKLTLSKKLDWWFGAFRRAAVAKKTVNFADALIKTEPGPDDVSFHVLNDKQHLDEIPEMPTWGEINLSDPCPFHITQEDMAAYGFDVLVEFNNTITDEEMRVFNMSLEADMAVGMPQFLGEATLASPVDYYQQEQKKYIEQDRGRLLSRPYTPAPASSSLDNSTHDNSTITPQLSPLIPHTPISSTFSPTLTHSTSPIQTKSQLATPATPPSASVSTRTPSSSSFPLTRKEASPELQHLITALATCEATATCPRCNHTGPVTLLFRGYMLVPDLSASRPEWRMCLRCSESGLK